MRKKSAQVALCGVLAGLAAALMALGGILPAATYCAPLLASLVLIPAREECGAKAAVAAVCGGGAAEPVPLCGQGGGGAVSGAGLLPARAQGAGGGEARGRWSSCASWRCSTSRSARSMRCCCSCSCPRRSRAEFHETTRIMQLVLLAAGNLVFLLYDLVLRRLEPLYRVRLQPVLRKLFR